MSPSKLLAEFRALGIEVQVVNDDTLILRRHSRKSSAKRSQAGSAGGTTVPGLPSVQRTLPFSGAWEVLGYLADRGSTVTRCGDDLIWFAEDVTATSEIRQLLVEWKPRLMRVLENAGNGVPKDAS